MSQKAVTAQLNQKSNYEEAVSSSKIDLYPLPDQSKITYEQIKTLKVGSYNTGHYGVEELNYERIAFYVTNNGSAVRSWRRRKAHPVCFCFPLTAVSLRAGKKYIRGSINPYLRRSARLQPRAAPCKEESIFPTQVMKGTMAGNDLWRVHVGNMDTNQGYLEFATADDGKEPVYLRQYTGDFAKSTNTVTLLDQYGNSDFQSITEKGNRV